MPPKSEIEVLFWVAFDCPLPSLIAVYAMSGMSRSAPRMSWPPLLARPRVAADANEGPTRSAAADHAAIVCRSIRVPSLDQWYQQFAAIGSSRLACTRLAVDALRPGSRRARRLPHCRALKLTVACPAAPSRRTRRLARGSIRWRARHGVPLSPMRGQSAYSRSRVGVGTPADVGQE